jgi:hypothetical protein
MDRQYRSQVVRIDHGPAVSTVGLFEDDLMSIVLPQYIYQQFHNFRFIAAGTKQGMADDKTLRFYFGADPPIVCHPPRPDNYDWRVEIDIGYRLPALYVYSLISHHSTFSIDSGYFTSDLSAGDVTAKMTGECANASDGITQLMFMMEWW